MSDYRAVRLSSVQRRLLSEQPLPQSPETQAPKPPSLPSLPSTPPVTAEPKAKSTEQLQDSAPVTQPVTHKVEHSIAAMRQLQQAAVAIEGAAFVLRNDFNDYTNANRIEQFKTELITTIGIIRERMQVAAKGSPEAERLVMQWFGH